MAGGGFPAKTITVTFFYWIPGQADLVAQTQNPKNRNQQNVSMA
jgi:hypothetical protein